MKKPNPLNQFAPICLFVYNRPEHTKKTLECLSSARLASESDLYIFADGPKAGASPDEIEKIHEVRKVIREKNWCKSTVIEESEANLGLAKSVVKGVTQIVNLFGSVIVIEDDLLVSKSFLEYMNTGLELYKDKEEVKQISGYIPSVSIQGNSAFFLPFTTSWGWGVWKRSWETLKNDSIEHRLSSFSWFDKYSFNLLNAVDYFEMLKDQMNEKIDSWAIVWYLNVFLKKGVILYPSKSLVKNIGFDNSGTHPVESDIYHTDLENVSIESFPDIPSIDFKRFIDIIDFFKKSKLYRFKNRMELIFSKFHLTLLKLMIKARLDIRWLI